MSKKSLTFKEYHEKYRTPISLIAYKCGLSYHQIYRLLGGSIPTLKTAVLIEQYTDGEVSCETMLPENIRNEISKQIDSTKD